MIRWFLITAVCTWLAGFFWFVSCLPHHSQARENISPGAYDLIVVLTGGHGRIDAALDLLQAEAAPKLLITGVGTNVTLSELIEQDVPAPKRESARYYESRVHLGCVARTTAGNAREVNGWMVAHPAKSMLLVTSNYHMPRSLYLFNAAFPNVQVDSYPTFGPAFSGNEWWRQADVLALAFSEYHKLLLSYVMYDVLGARLT